MRVTDGAGNAATEKLVVKVKKKKPKPKRKRGKRRAKRSLDSSGPVAAGPPHAARGAAPGSS